MKVKLVDCCPDLAAIIGARAKRHVPPTHIPPVPSPPHEVGTDSAGWRTARWRSLWATSNQIANTWAARVKVKVFAWPRGRVVRVPIPAFDWNYCCVTVGLLSKTLVPTINAECTNHRSNGVNTWGEFADERTNERIIVVTGSLLRVYRRVDLQQVRPPARVVAHVTHQLPRQQ